MKKDLYLDRFNSFLENPFTAPVGQLMGKICCLDNDDTQYALLSYRPSRSKPPIEFYVNPVTAGLDNLKIGDDVWFDIDEAFGVPVAINVSLVSESLPYRKAA